MKSTEEVERLSRIAAAEGSRSRARDYWEGVEDALRWMLGQETPNTAVFDVWLNRIGERD